MKVLVTGGAGFIGKHLFNLLSKNGHKITIFDSFSNSNKNSIEKIVQDNAKIIEGDITKFQDLINATKDQDIVIHLAAKISVEESISNPSETFRINIDGTKNLLVACEENHVKKIVAASSAAVYGEGFQGIKLTEETKINPISPYGESKVKMEKEIKKFISNKSIKCDILRFFNIFGHSQTPEYAGVITKFIKKIENDQPLDIFGDGMQTRDFVSVQDIVNSIEKSMLKIDKKSGIYNIARGESISIEELAKFMILLSRKDLKIQYLPPKKGDIKYSQADISLAKNELEYLPKYGLEDVKKMLK